MTDPWKDLIVWQKAHNLVIEIYKLTRSFPEDEKYGLIQQVRRSAVSVSANIVEGKSRKTKKEFSFFLHNSRGSLEETRYHIHLARDLGYITNKQYQAIEELSSEVSYLLNQLINSLPK